MAQALACAQGHARCTLDVAMSPKSCLWPIAIVLAVAPRASAQTAPREKVSVEGPLDTPTRAAELYGASVYTQGFGELQGGVDMGRVITPGIATELAAGYRIDPRWVVTIVGQYAEFAAQRASSARSLVTGVAVAYNLRPYAKLDPWVQIGAGYRILWESNLAPRPDLMTHGFEPARLMIGLDVRASRDISFAPLVGIDLTLPLWQSGGAGSTAIGDPRVSTFIFAGLMTRYDLTSHYVGSETRITQAEVCPPARP